MTHRSIQLAAALALAAALPGLIVAAEPSAHDAATVGVPGAPGGEAGLLGLPISVTIDVGVDRARVTIDAEALPLANDAELLLEFDAVENLCADSLGVSVALVDPFDPAFRARLPTEAHVPLALPLVVRVEPPPASSCGTLAFERTVRAELHTHLLPYSVDSPLRLYKAPLDGAFRDITASVEPGSVRTGGRTGGFSEFVVVLELLPSAAAAATNYDAIAARATGAAIAPALRAELLADLAASRAAFDANDRAGAIAALDAFAARVAGASPAELPDRWRATRDLDNVAGDLAGDAASLRYALTRP